MGCKEGWEICFQQAEMGLDLREIFWDIYCSSKREICGMETFGLAGGCKEGQETWDQVELELEKFFG